MNYFDLRMVDKPELVTTTLIVLQSSGFNYFVLKF